MTGLKAARRPIRELAHILEYRTSFGRPCYVKRNTLYAALIVPMLRSGADGPYSYIRTFQRATLHEAQVLGFVVLGEQLVDVPAFEIAGTHWCAEPAHQGRTIALKGGAA